MLCQYNVCKYMQKCLLPWFTRVLLTLLRMIFGRVVVGACRSKLPDCSIATSIKKKLESHNNVSQALSVPIHYVLYRENTYVGV